MYQPVQVTVRVDGRRVHRFQVVRERGEEGDPDERGERTERREGHRAEEWVVVGFTQDGVRLASTDLEWTREVPLDAFRAGRFEPLVAAGVPVWGY